MKALLAAALLSLTLGAAEPIHLWPKGVPGHEPKIEAERDLTKESENKVGGRRLIRLGNVSDPTIAFYPAPKDKANGAAVLVCPGGGYHILALDLEGTEVCGRLNEMGFAAILLKYRVPRRPDLEKHTAPLQDAQRAMGLIRQHAEPWGIDPQRIGVLGFSAGGHLAAMLSNTPDRTYPKADAADELGSLPNFSILIYPGYLTPDNDGSVVSPELKLTKETPQTFIIMAADDPVRAENALTYAAALVRLKVPVELHLYPTGGHGYGLRKTEEPVTSWPDLLEIWFKARKIAAK